MLYFPIDVFDKKVLVYTVCKYLIYIYSLVSGLTVIRAAWQYRSVGFKYTHEHTNDSIVIARLSHFKPNKWVLHCRDSSRKLPRLGNALINR